jgi:hypothetical protein
MDHVDWNAELVRDDLGPGRSSVQTEAGQGPIRGRRNTPTGVGGAGIDRCTCSGSIPGWPATDPRSWVLEACDLRLVSRRRSLQARWLCGMSLEGSYPEPPDLSVLNPRDLRRESQADRKVVGAEGFEPPTLWSQTRCATRLRYAPTELVSHARQQPVAPPVRRKRHQPQDCSGI